MRVLDITSNLITKAVYYEASKELLITFRNGDRWKYSEVAKEEITLMMNAPSQGSYFVKYIKPNYKAEKL